MGDDWFQQRSVPFNRTCIILEQVATLRMRSVVDQPLLTITTCFWQAGSAGNWDGSRPRQIGFWRNCSSIELHAFWREQAMDKIWQTSR